MADKLYRFQIYDSTGGSVEHTIASSQLGGIGTVGGQVAKILEGRTESEPWHLDVLDSSTNYFTSKIADSSGRMTLLRRLADVQVSVSGSTYQTIATGRISHIADHISHFTVTVDDERLLERTATVFNQTQATTYATDNGTSGLYTGAYLIPPGLQDNWDNFGPPRTGFNHGSVVLTTGNWRVVETDKLIYGVAFGDWFIPAGLSIHPHALQMIRDDFDPEASVDEDSTEARFRTLQAEVVSSSGTADYGVVGFGLVGSTEIGADAGLSYLDEVAGSGELILWVVLQASGLPSTGVINNVRLKMPTYKPTQAAPLYVGGQTGIHPFQLLQDLYDEVGVRYTTDLDDLIADPDYGEAYWRITEPSNLAKWVEDNIYRPYGVVPFIDRDGKVLPKRILLPRSCDVSDDISTLTEITSTGAAIPHPSWNHGLENIITRLRFEYTTLETFNPGQFLTGPPSGWDAGLIIEAEHEVTRDHDYIDNFGIHEETVLLRGLHRVQNILIPNPFGGGAITHWGVDRFADIMAREYFQRAGDGTITGSLTPVSSAFDQQPGDLIRITLDTFPSPQSQDRGGTRIVQLTEQRWEPAGPTYNWIDVGPALAPTCTPTIALIQSTSDTRHALKLTIGGITTGIGWELQTAVSTAEPSSTSNRWKWRRDGTGPTTEVLRAYPSGQNVWGRVRSAMPNRVRSAWSTAASSTTASLTAPSALATSSLDSDSVRMFWTNGETAYPTEITLDESATCPTTDPNIISTLIAGSNTYEVTGLTADTTHCLQVRHRDSYGGRSSAASLSFETTNTPSSAPALVDIYLLVGTS